MEDKNSVFDTRACIDTCISNFEKERAFAFKKVRGKFNTALLVWLFIFVALVFTPEFSFLGSLVFCLVLYLICCLGAYNGYARSFNVKHAKKAQSDHIQRIERKIQETNCILSQITSLYKKYDGLFEEAKQSTFKEFEAHLHVDELTKMQSEKALTKELEDDKKDLLREQITLQSFDELQPKTFRQYFATHYREHWFRFDLFINDGFLYEYLWGRISLLFLKGLIISLKECLFFSNIGFIPSFHGHRPSIISFLECSPYLCGVYGL